jgi:sulfite reductase (NADPH) flavoprotein alpha-component
VESEVHVTVGVVRYDIEGRARAGGASSFLADRVEEDGEVRVFIDTTITSVCLPTRRRR